MNEADWWAGNADQLLDWLFHDTRAADRKLRLFSLTCCRRILRAIPNWPRGRRLIDLLENRIAGRLDDRAFAFQIDREDDDFFFEHLLAGHVMRAPGEYDLEDGVLFGCYPHGRSERSRTAGATPYPMHAISRAAICVALSQPDEAFRQSLERDSRDNMAVLHELFGPQPVRDVMIDPSWLSSDVMRLARRIEVDQAFDQMPILADALQDAGCPDVDILNHCRREPEEHVRGCWVIDILLGRPWREPTLPGS